jgi:hypothetical protein
MGYLTRGDAPGSRSFRRKRLVPTNTLRNCWFSQRNPGKLRITNR